MADKIKIDDESDFAYNITDSEDNYSEDEKELLEEVQKSQRKEKSKVEDVLAFTESEAEDDDYDGDDGDIDSEEDAEDMADSDIERARESDLNDEEINTKYWGKTKRNYYNTDFVDQDYSSYNEKEEELAKMEEEEANNIRLRLIKELKEEDFLLDTFSNKTSKETRAMEVASSSSTFPDEKLFSSVQLKADFTKLTKRERLQLFEKDSPEFAALIGDLENYLDEIRKIHNPVLEYCHQNDVPMIPALRFTQHYQNIVLTYCNNLMFYLLLKCACTASVQHHPVIKRLNQLKKLLNQLDDKHENIIKPQLEALLERIIDGDNFKILEQTNTEVKMSTKKMEQKAKKMNGEMSMNKKNVKFIEKDPMKNTKHNNQCKNNENDNDYMDSVDDNLDENDINENIEDGNADEYSNDDDFNKDKVGIRRGITYEIAKNKGLTPHRKKEQRNPRVKHRGKYRKALIRRKGAIRNVRKEIKRYNGEISGIKATVSKSIKFKT